MADNTETLFTVARGTTVLNTGLRASVAAARSDLAAVQAAMRTAGLEPDVQLATVTRTTTVSDPAPYVEETITVDDASAEDAASASVDEPQATDQPKKTSR